MIQENKNGFTLIEISIVVIIVGVLAAMALTKYTNLVQREAIKRARLDILTIVSAIEIYRAKYGEYPDEEGLYPCSHAECTEKVNQKLGLNISNSDFYFNFGVNGGYSIMANKLTSPYDYYLWYPSPVGKVQCMGARCLKFDFWPYVE